MSELQKYSGEWSETQARHLLRRTTFGPSEKAVSEATQIGLDKSIEKLLNDSKFTINRNHKNINLRGPLKFTEDGSYKNLGKGLFRHDDPAAKQGYSWASEDMVSDMPTNTDGLTDLQIRQRRNTNRAFRRRSLRAWIFLQMDKADFNIRMKLALFWHNHFVAPNGLEYRDFFHYTLLIENALGNFREFTKKITLDFSMMHFLDNNGNQKTAPNENYARELLELFTLGKGESVGKGDYTNYTENDIVEIAKALTGWKFFVADSEPKYRKHHHTPGDKQLSARFNKVVIKENGENEYSDVIDVIFKQPSCADFLAKNLYQWFVKPTVTEEIEANIIKPLGKIIRDNDYEVIPALKALLSSKHFFESNACMIKSPVDFMFSLRKTMEVNFPEARESNSESIINQYVEALLVFDQCTEMEQTVLSHDEVAGWKAYYQSPIYDKVWINSHLAPLRLSFAKNFINGGKIFIRGGGKDLLPLDVLKIIKNIDNSKDPNALIKALAKRLFNYPISESQITRLKGFLIPGLPDYEWALEYQKHLDNPRDKMMKMAVEKRLRSLISVMVQMPEFQIM